MKNLFKRSCAGLLTVVCLISLLGFRASAASGRISYSDPSVTVGNDVTVTMTVSSDMGIGAVDATLTYDSSLLEYLSGSSSSGALISGGSGSISVSWMGTNQPTSISCTFTFKTKNSGTAKINTSYAEVSTLDEETVSLSSYGSSTITISPKPTASSEARLASLKVSSASLSPSFSPDTYEYSATVAAGTKKAVLSLSTKDDGASYTISDTSLKVGANTIKVTVKAEDGTTKIYTIKVTRPEDPVTQEPDEPDESEEPEEPDEPAEVPVTVTVDGITCYVAESLEGVTLPEGFEEKACTYQEKEISVAQGLAKPLTLFWLTNESGENGAFFIYDETADLFYPYRDITSGQKIYTLINVPADSAVPAGYTEASVTIGETTVTAWTSEEQSEFVLVYAMNWNGETGFYRYDMVEQSMQRYVGELEVVERVPEDIRDEEKELLMRQNQELQKSLVEADELMHKGKLLIFALMGVAVILLVLIICVLIFTGMRGRRSAEQTPVQPPVQERPAVQEPRPVKKETPKDEEEVDLSKLGLGDVDLSQVDVDDIDFDSFDF